MIKVTVKLTDGRTRTIKQRNDFENIDPTRKVLFLLTDNRVVEGYTDGEEDEDGYITVRKSRKKLGIACEVRVSAIFGWTYSYRSKKGGDNDGGVA